jgi:hypothetical protein
MATAKAKRRRNLKQQSIPPFEDFPVFNQQKFPVYQALFNLNVAFQSLAYEIERLDDNEAIPLETLRLYRTTAEELRSAMNHRITGILLGREERDWYHYGKEKREIEERQKD